MIAMLYRIGAVYLAILIAAPIGAQAQMRSVVVPPDATVTVPSRGAFGPRLTQAPPRARAEPQDAFSDEEYTRIPRQDAIGLSPLAVLVPTVAAAILGGSLAGSGNGGSAPTRTR